MSATQAAAQVAVQMWDAAAAAVTVAPPPPPTPPPGGGVLPNPAPVAPPGAEKITTLIGYLRWGAGAAIVAGFLAGLILFAGGRILDHDRFGRIGATMLVVAVGAAFLYGIGYSVLSAFAGTG